VHPGDLAGGFSDFSDLEMTWLLYCAGAATATKLKVTEWKYPKDRRTKTKWKVSTSIEIWEASVHL